MRLYLHLAGIVFSILLIALCQPFNELTFVLCWGHFIAQVWWGHCYAMSQEEFDDDEKRQEDEHATCTEQAHDNC